MTKGAKGQGPSTIGPMDLTRLPGGKDAPNATAKETAERVSEVADLNRAIAKEQARDSDA